MSPVADRAAADGDVRIYPARGEVCVGVRVTPSARKTRLVGLHGDRLKVAVSAPPEDNRANRELEAALAGWLGLARDGVSVVKGHGSRDKVVAFKRIDEAGLRREIGIALRREAGHGSR